MNRQRDRQRLWRKDLEVHHVDLVPLATWLCIWIHVDRLSVAESRVVGDLQLHGSRADYVLNKLVAGLARYGRAQLGTMIGAPPLPVW